MYIPDHFRETEPAKIFDFAEQYSFATLVTQHDGAPFASHIPLLLERETGPHGTIVGHVARANPQWRDAAGQTALVMFSGPHAYISPSWYAEPNTVPTWNYAAVHAYGKLELIEEPAALTALTARMVDVYEQGFAEPWRLDAGTPLVAALVKQIVGFRVAVERWEGKWKLNQNHSAERRRRVAAALERQPGSDARTIAEWIRAALGESS